MAPFKPKFLKSLAAQLLALTILFVVLVQVFIYVPSLAQFRLDYLEQRLVAAQIAALALEETPGQMVSPGLEAELLESAEIQAVIVIREDSRQLILRSELPPELAARYDLRDVGFGKRIVDAFATLVRAGHGSIQIEGQTITARHQSVQVVMSEAPLYAAMVAYSGETFFTTLAISVAIAMVIYLFLMVLVVRPTRKITESLAAFAKTPESRASTLVPGGRTNEIGTLEQQIAGMQKEIRQALRQKTSLANLGLAVSKINHDLRNILSTARLSMDALKARPTDERQRRILERFLKSVDKAVVLSERTLKYGRADEPDPEKRDFALAPLIHEIEQSLKDEEKGLHWNINIPRDFKIFADRDQLYRVLFNLCRNALEAMAGVGAITIRAGPAGDGKDFIEISDSGPGIPEGIRANLFVPFAASTKGSGSGLGLVIANELVKAHGGKLSLVDAKEGGAIFRIVLPARS